jgi:hypothetical protein
VSITSADMTGRSIMPSPATDAGTAPSRDRHICLGPVREPLCTCCGGVAILRSSTHVLELRWKRDNDWVSGRWAAASRLTRRPESRGAWDGNGVARLEDVRLSRVAQDDRDGVDQSGARVAVRHDD